MNTIKKVKALLICFIVLEILATLHIIKCCIDLTYSEEKTKPTIVADNTVSLDTLHETELPQDTEQVSATEPTVLTASIGAMGDLLMHKPVFDDLTYNAAVQQPDGTYNFDSIFKYIRDYLIPLDYTVANLETTLCGEDNGYSYSGFPHFNCPDEIISGVKYAGFDMLLTANNHSYDTGIVGYKRTLDVIQGEGLKTLGTYKTAEETKWTIEQINGINIGMLCYTWAYSITEDGRPSLNGNSAISEAGLCNFFHSSNLDPFYEDVKKYVDQMETAGAEVTIMYIHWGIEYNTFPNESQKQMAQTLCDIGIDVIIGGHPHVVQPIELLESNVDPNHKTVCIYSTGNAVSNQRVGNISDVHTAHTEDGLLFSVFFEKESGGDVHLAGVEVLPTWVYMHNNDDGKTEYNILPLDWNNKNEWKEMFSLNDAMFQAAQDSYHRTMDIVSDGLLDIHSYLSEIKQPFM